MRNYSAKFAAKVAVYIDSANIHPSEPVRVGNGVFLTGGTSTGRTSTDNCDIIDDVPENVLAVAATAPNLPFCHVDTKWLTQAKGSASYTVPKVDMQVAGTYQFLPGPELTANWAVNNAIVQGSLGRPLTGGNQTVNVVAPGTMFGESLHQLDMRVSKIVRFGTTKTMISFDLYNATNSSTILTYNNGFVPLAGVGANWLQPNSILQARFFKIGAQFDW